ncbi:hypothetical protein M413DRAFT_445505 [Hebeloma cylindrosporum]|uniref:Phosphatidylglycerol lysyltransferase C-terminal domain-containing protein n=1 Tax=Hebeloma cylindrosporum TaxID=76867 RepID=A0A0C3CD24_HEBCY|nr:hypothetical protein M413DRAFT_445505 [Hebeloma cylindrosporum h7]
MPNVSTQILEPKPVAATIHAPSRGSPSPEPSHSVGASAFSSSEHLSATPPGFASWLSSNPTGYQGLEQTPSLADLIASRGSSSSTAWLESERYKIWRPSQPIPESEFPPAQGYIQRDPFVFAWGNPIVSSPATLEKTARAFIAFVEANHLRPLWACVDQDLEKILANEPLGWVTVSCIYEDVMDPEHVIELFHPKHRGKELTHVADELKNHLLHAEKDMVEVYEVKSGDWTDADREAVELGIKEWKSHKHGILEINSLPKLGPWTDEQHRRYWIARWQRKIVGVEILAPTSPTSWQIIKCLTFHHASEGTAEKLIYTALKALCDEQEDWLVKRRRFLPSLNLQKKRPHHIPTLIISPTTGSRCRSGSPLPTTSTQGTMSAAGGSVYSAEHTMPFLEFPVR